MTGPGRLAAGIIAVLAIQGLLVYPCFAASDIHSTPSVTVVSVAPATSAPTAGAAVTATAAASSTSAAAGTAAWSSKAFEYERPASQAVEELTPTAGQVGAFLRPAQTSADAPAPKATGLRSGEAGLRPGEAGPAAPRVVGAFNVVHLRFRDVSGEDVPVLLCTPKDSKGPFPLVIAVHGLTSNKGQVVAQVGSALATKGFAVMAPDLPCHGERPGEPLQVFAAGRLQKAVIDVRQCMDIAESRPEIDSKTGVTLVGYSLGSWVSGVTGGADPRVKALVLMVGGTFDMGVGDRSAPVMDVRQAIAHYAGRPLLMLNGKMDVLVSPDSSRRLFAAAGEPKKQVWYDSGHLLPASAYQDAAEWIDKTIRPVEEKKSASATEKPPAK
jgi:dienelactone hydrolase